MNIVQKPAASGNYEAGRHGYAVSRITFHHIVGDAPAAIARFQTPGVQVSAHYVIGSNGQVYQCVAEQNTAYCDGNYDSNLRTISIEHAGGIAGVPYTEAMYAASIELVHSLIQRYGIKDFQRHRDVIDKSRYPGGTACPGQLDVERIVNNAKIGAEEMITSEEQVRSMYIAYWGENPNSTELKQWLSGGGTLDNLRKALDSNPKHAAFFNKAASADALQVQVNQLKAEQGNADEANKLGQALIKLLTTFGYKKS